MNHRRFSAALCLAAVIAAGAASQARAADTLTLDPTIIFAEEEGGDSRGALMMALGKAGMDKPLDDLGINIYGWIESGYTYNHRHGTGSASIPIVPGPLNHQFGNHYMLNQVALRFERMVASDKFDVGGMIEVNYGTDAARMHSTGMGFDGSDPTDDNDPVDDLAVANLHPIHQFDIPQAYLVFNIPVGNGLQLMVGKFITLLGYETVDPRPNAFYSHSYLFSGVNYSNTGVLGSYQINDQWGVKLGVSRGWDITLEDNNGCAIDVLGQFSYTPNDQMAFYFNWTTGPQNDEDTGHYRTVLNGIMTWQVTEQLSFAVDTLYVYDGGINGEPGDTGHYGDAWGLALYASYQINEYITANARVEKAHSYLGTYAGFDFEDILGGFTGISTTNFYEVTLGVTIYPFPRDAWLKGLRLRPEIRYDWSEDAVFPANDGYHSDQLTFGADVIFEF